MTRDLVARARIRVGPNHAGKVLLLNDATRLGHTPAEKDIQSPAESTYQGALTLFSRLKASTGRLVRLIEHGQIYPEDFGAEVDSAEASNVLDDPHVRHFLSRYVVEYVERAFEPPTSEDLLEALVVIGRPLSVVDLEELLRTDLDRYLFQDELGRWNVTPLGREEQARAKRERKEERRRRAEHARRDHAETRTGGGSQPLPDSVRMTQKEALETLAIGLDTPRDQALKRYRSLLMRFHPDKFHDDEQFRQMAEGKTKRINAAWALIKDRLPEGNPFD
jgi:DnaJ-domain-containing protein 1